jgi:hypothetical protein
VPCFGNRVKGFLCGRLSGYLGREGFRDISYVPDTSRRTVHQSLVVGIGNGFGKSKVRNDSMVSLTNR